MPNDLIAELRRSYPKRDLAGLERVRATPGAIGATWTAFLIVLVAVVAVVWASHAAPPRAAAAPAGARIPAHSSEAFCARQAASLVECRRFDGAPEPARTADLDF